MSERSFQVGQQVTVIAHSIPDLAPPSGIALPVAICAVLAVGPRKMTVDLLPPYRYWSPDGSRRYGNKNVWYSGPYVREFQEGDTLLLRRSLNLSRIRDFSNWDSLEDGELQKVADVIHGYKVRCAPEKHPP